MFKKLFFLISFLVIALIVYSEERKYLVQIEDDLWIYKEKENSLYRLTYDREPIDAAIWSPDGKYIAYGYAEKDYTAYLIILDEAGQEICKMTLSPLKDDNYRGNVRWIRKIEWRKDNTIITRCNVSGPHGSILDIWEIDSSFICKHIKRINTCWTVDCTISPKKDYMACINYSFGIIKDGETPKEEDHLIISDLSKKYDPEDTYFEDPEPKEIEIDMDILMESNDIEYLSDDEILIIPKNKKEFYIYNLKEEKLEKVKNLPKEVVLKDIPKMLKFKIKGKEYDLKQSRQVLDFFIEKMD